MKHLFTLKSLLLTLVMLCGLNAWGETETFNFVDWKFDGASKWNSDYLKRTISGSAYKVEFASANKQSSNATITDRPVTKGGDIIVSPLSSDVTITGVELTLTKWGTKTQTVTLNVSSDGTNFTATSTKSSNFSLSASELDAKAVKFTFSSSKNQVGVESIEVTYTTAGGGEAVTVAKPTIEATPTPVQDDKYYLNTDVTATIKCATEGATIQYAITGNDVTDAATIESWTEGATVSITSEVAGTKILWAKAVKDGKESVVASKEFTFIEKPEQITFEQVTSESQIVPGRKYVIACTGATEKAVMNVIESGKSFFSAVKSNVSYADNKLSFVNSDAVYVTFEKAAASFANGHANDKATTIWNVKIGDEYITSTTEKNMVMSAEAPTNITMSIDAEGNFVLKFGANYFCYNSGSPRFTTYDSQGTGNSDVAIQLFREPEAMASVMGATAETAVELPVSVVGRKVFGDYLLASTVNNGGAQLESPSLAEAKHFWSNDPEKFNQESWIAIEGLDDNYVGKEFEVGQTLTAAGADATYGFPTYTVATPSTSNYAGALEINDYSASNFNIGGTDESVANVWLVAPQLGEYCQIHGYVDADLADETYAWVQANEKSNVYATVYFNGLPKFTTSGWYNIEGVVAKDGEGLAIYATAVDTATGVEGVEASSVKVYGAEGVINVVSEEVAPIAVYSANGAIVSSVEASSASIAVAPGFYIVKAGNSVSKVTVK